MSWIHIMISILMEMGLLITSPVFLLVVVIVWLQNKRIAKLKSTFFSLPKESVWRQTVQSVGLGLLGGMIGSFFMILLGISVYDVGIEYLWILALLLAMIHPRLICFAYAGGILAGAAYFFPAIGVNISHIIALIGTLHLVEAILVYLSGDLHAIPIYLKGKKDHTIGGYLMQNFWPMPLISVALLQGGQSSEAMFDMPNWWPLLSSNLAEGQTMLYVLLPIVAALGYSDVAIASKPKEKAKESAKGLMIYSVALILCAILEKRLEMIGLFAAISAPLGHEWLIYSEKKREEKKEPLFIRQENGVRILSVQPKSQAAKQNIASGDIVMKMDGENVYRYRDMVSLVLHQSEHQITILHEGKERMIRLTDDVRSWGMIPVPEDNSRYLQFSGAFQYPKMLCKKIRKR